MKKGTRKNLVDLRQKRELTQAQTAEKLGITVRQYSRLEAGTSDGSVKVWQHLKELLKAKSIDFLLEQEVETNVRRDNAGQRKGHDGKGKMDVI